VENDARAVSVIKANATRLGAGDRVRVLGGSALALPQSEPFDLIFADPPYAAGSASAVIAAVAKGRWLAPAGWMSVETAHTDIVDPGGYQLETTRDVGRARLWLLRFSPLS
jgi:16S rRNA (guanine966-N2)-methyltransferase